MKPTEEFIRAHQQLVQAGARLIGGSSDEGAGGDGWGMYAGPGDNGFWDGGSGPGGVFVRSETYTDLKRRFPSGEVPRGFATDPVVVGKYRALVTASDTSAGALTQPPRFGPFGPGSRPLSIRQLVTVIPVTSGPVEFSREVSRVSAAAPVAEATALTGTSGTKPEGGIQWELVEAPIRTIAVWVPTTSKVLSDAPRLREAIDGYLTEDVLLETEDQMVAGSGAGENFLGILNTPGIQTEGPPGAGESMVYALRRGIRKVRQVGRSAATAVVLNPVDSAELDLLEVNGETNHFVSDPFEGGPQTVWKVPRVESEAVPAGTGLVGDFSKAILFDREQATVQAGYINDQFVRNMVTLLGELRAAFGVVRPSAFCSVDLAA